MLIIEMSESAILNNIILRCLESHNSHMLYGVDIPMRFIYIAQERQIYLCREYTCYIIISFLPILVTMSRFHFVCSVHFQIGLDILVWISTETKTTLKNNFQTDKVFVRLHYGLFEAMLLYDKSHKPIWMFSIFFYCISKGTIKCIS